MLRQLTTAYLSKEGKHKDNLKIHSLTRVSQDAFPPWSLPERLRARVLPSEPEAPSCRILHSTLGQDSMPCRGSQGSPHLVLPGASGSLADRLQMTMKSAGDNNQDHRISELGRWGVAPGGRGVGSRL